MRSLSTRVHGLLDYAIGLLIVASPWLLGFAGTAAAWPAIGAGTLLILSSLLTDYEPGVVRWIEPSVHLWLDGVLGLLLAISPWLVGFDQQLWIPHVALGALLMVMALFSNTIPGYERRRR